MIRKYVCISLLYLTGCDECSDRNMPAEPQLQEVSSETLNQSIDLDRVLWVIKQLESSGGKNCKPRFEPEFLKRYGTSGNMPELRKLYGDQDAASSFGPYQIMLSTANEYEDISPQELAKPVNNERIARQIVEKYFNQYKDQDNHLWMIFKRYNGGDQYANRGVEIYDR